MKLKTWSYNVDGEDYIRFYDFYTDEKFVSISNNGLFLWRFVNATDNHIEVDDNYRLKVTGCDII